MRVYLIEGGYAARGVEAEDYTLRGCGVTIKVVSVGESGRGRKYDFITVSPGCISPGYTKKTVDVQVASPLTNSEMIEYWPIPPKGWEEDKRERVLERFLWEEPHMYTNRRFYEGTTVYTQSSRVYAAEIGETRSGKAKLVCDHTGNRNGVIAVLRTHTGFRGHNAHTGDYMGWKCISCGKDGDKFPRPEKCPNCGNSGHSFHSVFAEFPGKILAEGIIAEGAAGRAGHGYQYIAVIPNGRIFRTAYTGRLYGAPSSHYFKVEEGKILGGITAQERAATDIF